MLLTGTELNKILQIWKISIPNELKKELLEQYGNLAIDNEGHLHDYTKQDICEQLRKRLCPYEKSKKEVPDLT
jgi:hypothetical protein